jgi:hypothetical protein
MGATQSIDVDNGMSAPAEPLQQQLEEQRALNPRPASAASVLPRATKVSEQHGSVRFLLTAAGLTSVLLTLVDLHVGRTSISVPKRVTKPQLSPPSLLPGPVSHELAHAQLQSSFYGLFRPDECYKKIHASSHPSDDHLCTFDHAARSQESGRFVCTAEDFPGYGIGNLNFGALLKWQVRRLLVFFFASLIHLIVATQERCLKEIGSSLPCFSACGISLPDSKCVL